MDTEKDKKVLQAFWCMYNSAKKKKRNISYYSDAIYIYANGKEGTGRIGELKLEIREEELVLKKYLFGLKKIEIIEEEVIYVSVTNTQKNETFYGSFEGEEVKNIKEKLLFEIELNTIRENKASEKALNDLIC